MSDGHAIQNAVEQVRQEAFQDLDKDLVRDVLTSHIELQDRDRAEARAQTERLVSRWVSEHLAAPDEAGEEPT
jgi:hypothetical protein